MFSDLIVSLSQYMPRGNLYTFTYTHGRAFEYRSEDYVLMGLKEHLYSWGEVISVKRPLFSDHYVIVLKSTMDMTLGDWKQAFEDSWRKLGYNNTELVIVDQGVISSQPGGISVIGRGIEETIAGTVGATITSTIKPIYPYILGAIAVYAAINILPSLVKRRS